MENASKALIIAGAILISILLISVGIIVMNSMNKPIDQAAGTADSQAVEMFNSRFTSYAGAGQKAQSIKSLCTAVASSNGADRAHVIKLYYKANTSGAPWEDLEAGILQAKVKSQGKYDVDLLYAEKKGNGFVVKLGSDEPAVTSEQGYIAGITIKEQ